MARRKKWYNRDDVVCDPRIAHEAKQYAEDGVAYALMKQHKRRHTCPYCRTVRDNIDDHIFFGECRPTRLPPERTFGNWYDDVLGKPVKGSLSWAIANNTFRK